MSGIGLQGHGPAGPAAIAICTVRGAAPVPEKKPANKRNAEPVEGGMRNPEAARTAMESIVERESSRRTGADRVTPP